MPRFFFNYRERNEHTIDDNGVEFDTFELAWLDAFDTAREMWAENMARRVDPRACKFGIRPMDQRSNGHSSAELAGAHILLVEDDRLILMDLEATIEDAGAAMVETCTDVSAVLSRDTLIDAAILDIRLRDESIAPVARQLGERSVPFVFYSGQSQTGPIHQEWPDNKVIQKPAPAHTIVSALVDALEHRPVPERGDSVQR